MDNMTKIEEEPPENINQGLFSKFLSQVVGFSSNQSFNNFLATNKYTSPIHKLFNIMIKMADVAIAGLDSVYNTLESFNATMERREPIFRQKLPMNNMDSLLNGSLTPETYNDMKKVVRESNPSMSEDDVGKIVYSMARLGFPGFSMYQSMKKNLEDVQNKKNKIEHDRNHFKLEIERYTLLSKNKGKDINKLEKSIESLKLKIKSKPSRRLKNRLEEYQNQLKIFKTTKRKADNRIMNLHDKLAML